MHGNRCSVKLAWIGLAAGLAFVSPARAELVAPIGTKAVLAVGPKEAPIVAYTDGAAVLLARRGSGLVWNSRRVGLLPAGTWALAGMAVDRRGRPSILAEDLRAGRLVLVRLTRGGWRTTVLASTRGGTQLGPGGVVLDAFGLPAVAYGVRRPDGKTFLRLTRLGRRGRFVTQAVTRGGFPASSRVPAATPVRVGRTVHVVEAVGSAAIDWGPTKKGWEGQYLFTSQFGSVVGPVAAAARGGTLHAGLTLDLPQFGESNVVAIASARGQVSDVVFPHALLAALTVPRTGREMAANDFVGDVFAGLVATPTLTAELDGRIDGYAAIEEGSRYVLLAHPTGLEFYAVPAVLPVAVHLAVTLLGSTVALDGSVTGARGGEVEIYRETPTSREFMIRAALGPDGTFAVREAPLPSGVFYRAVYREPTTGLPYAALARSSCCATRPR
jgi:hypothetical protein